MRVPAKLLSFGFWLLSLNFARCQECLREDIKYENTEPVAKASYADGETMKVNCMTGYTGLYKLKCEKGEWKQSIERQCAKRKCGHPGDTPHGDFKLMEGTEFVFGATVVYTCKKGYEMTSRINQRTCRAQGWDNTVPMCEVVKCPAIHTDGDVTVSGNTEEGSYGDVIHFECVSSDKMIDGSSDIHCEETGKWSDAVPKCKEITCTTPVIPNGYVVEPRAKYQKDAILKYSCNPGFKKREGIPRCAKFGWTLNLECDEITCELKSTFEVQKINPKGKTIFRAGESVEITCSEKYWFIFTKETSKSFTCKYNGEWDHTPVCEEITCEDPRDQHVSRPYFWREMKLGEKQSYSCKSGYRKTAEVATCTQDGWTPKPLCAEVTCELKSTTFGVQKINPKGKTIFRVGESVEITCSEKYWFIFTKKNSRSFTCQYNGQWDYEPVCEEKTCELKSTTFGVEKTNPKGKTIFRVGESVEITCSEKYWFIFTKKNSRSFTCQYNGQWDYEPVCEDITCEDPHYEYVSRPYWGNLKLGAKKSYSCESGYRETAAEATCTRDGWTPKPLCTEITCELKSTTSGVQTINPKGKTIFRPGESVEIICSENNWLYGTEKSSKSFTCKDNGEWDQKPVCEEKTCELKSTTFGVEKTNPKGKTIFRVGESVEITCSEKYWFIFTKKNSRSFTCQYNGQWDYEPVCEDITCEDPHYEYVSRPYWGNLKLGAKKSYSCESGYRETAAEATCTRDGWTPKPLCTEITCVLKSTTSGVQTINPKGKTIFRPGESVEIICSENNWLKGTEKSSKSFTCKDNGEWDQTPVCEDITCEYPRDQHVSRPNWRNLKLGEKQSYSCESGYRKTAEEAKCTQDGWTPKPLCTAKCGPPPHMNDADIKEMRKNEYNTGETVEYNCSDTYTMDLHSSKYLTCEEGEWKGNIKCLKPCIVTVEEMDKRGIRLRWKTNENIISKHNDSIGFECQSSKTADNNLLRQKCNDGVMILPECV